MQNSSSLFLKQNSFFDNKMLINEKSQDETAQSYQLFPQDKSVFSGQDNESRIFQIDEDSNNNFWPETDNTIIDMFKDSPQILDHMNDNKPLNEKVTQFGNHSNLILDENISIENKSFSFIPIVNESNELEFFNMNKISEEEEKSSGLSGDSFLSVFDISPIQDNIYFENINNNEFNLMDEEKKDFLNINIKEQIEEINKNKDNKENISKNDISEEKKKAKINFFVSKKEDKVLTNIDNTMKSLDNQKNSENIKKEFIGKKREKDIKNQNQISKNATKNSKINNLNEINKVTILNSKAFKCECGKVFSTEENQRLHYINIHLHEKPYNCSYCGEGFSHRNGKIYHERVYHTFVFPYPCKECSHAFASKSALIYHMKSKHKTQ